MTQPSRGELLLAGLLIVGIVAVRLMPHVPNFSPVLAVALLSGYMFKSHLLRWSVPLVGAALSDVLLGTYGITMYAVWSCYVLAGIGAGLFRHRLNGIRAVASAAIASAGFFVITNLAVWAEGMLYARTWQGLIDCYVAAIPFFRMTLISTSIYALAFYLVGQVVAKRMEHHEVGGFHA